MQSDERAARRGIGGHHRGFEGHTDEWLTPPEIIAALGSFDLDPCSPVNRPWPTAAQHYTEADDGLMQPWAGRVWLNPPYGPRTATWLARLAMHGRGTALTFARTETAMFFRHVWPAATAVLFLEGRLHFYNVKGQRAPANAGGPSVLIAYGTSDADRLQSSGIRGRFLNLERKAA